MATYRGTIAVSTVYTSFPDIILAHAHHHHRRPTPNGGGRRKKKKGSRVEYPAEFFSYMQEWALLIL